MAKRGLLWAGTGVLVVSTGITLAKLWKSPAAEQRASVHEVLQQPAAMVAPSSTGAVFTKPYEYRLRLATRIVAASQNVYELVLTGTLKLKPETSAGGDQTVVGRLSRVELDEDSSQAASVRFPPNAGEQFSEPFAFVLGSDGKIKSASFSQHADVETVRLLRAIVGQLQVSRSAGTSEWDSIEEDLNGRFLVHYAVDPGARVLKRQKLRWLDQANSGGALDLRTGDAELGESRGELRFDQEGSIESLTAHETLKLKPPAAFGMPELESVTDLRLDERRRLDEQVTVSTALGRPIGITQEPAVASRSYAADLQRTGGRKLPNIVAELKTNRQLAKSKVTDAERTRLYVATTALLRRDPSAVSQVTKLIEERAPESSFFVHALGDAGSSEATRALTKLLARTPDRDTKKAVLSALGRSGRPSSETVETMAAALADKQVGGLARLMLGSLAYGVRDAAPELAAAAVAHLTDALAKESDPLRVSDTLRALGNSGHSAAIAAARSYASSDSALLRAAAAQAVRRTIGDVADRLLAELMHDGSVSVRVAALDAALYRTPTPALGAAVDEVLRLDTEASVRREAIRVMAAWQVEYEPARQSLVWAALNDENQKLRAVANDGLHRYPETPAGGSP